MKYNLELNKAVKEIKKSKAKNVLIQLPDGLKPKAIDIVNYLKKHTKANILIWFSTCYGACDYPNIKEIDLLIQWGHKKWMK